MPIMTVPPHDAAAACLFDGLGDPARLAILRHLAAGEKRVGELADLLGLAQSTVSQHLACLRGCDLVTARPVGRATVHSLAHPGAMMALFEAADVLLAQTDDAALLCPSFGDGLAAEVAS